MSDELRAKVPELSRMFRLQWEEAQQSYVLLYPEGMVQLNGPAGEILNRVDGAKSVDQIIAELQNEFPDAESLAQDVLEFMEEAHEQNWISL